MNEEILKKIPLNAFDEDGWLKLTLYMYINLLFLAKGIVIAIFALVSMGKGNEIINIFYPNVSALYLDMALSIIPIITFISLVRGKMQALVKIKKILLILCFFILIIELTLNLYNVLLERNPMLSMAFQLLIIHVLLLWFSISSPTTRIFIVQLLQGKPCLKP